MSVSPLSESVAPVVTETVLSFSRCDCAPMDDKTGGELGIVPVKRIRGCGPPKLQSPDVDVSDVAIILEPQVEQPTSNVTISFCVKVLLVVKVAVKLLAS